MLAIGEKNVMGENTLKKKVKQSVSKQTDPDVSF